MSTFLTPTVRRWIYGVLLAAFPVACFYLPELVPASPLWLALALAILNVKDEPRENGLGGTAPEIQE
jgi:hypothetical protein